MTGKRPMPDTTKTTADLRFNLLCEAANRLDMAFALVEDERVAKRFAETRDKIREEIKNGR